MWFCAFIHILLKFAELCLVLCLCVMNASFILCRLLTVILDCFGQHTGFMESKVRKAATQVTGGQQPAGWFNTILTKQCCLYIVTILELHNDASSQGQHLH